MQAIRQAGQKSAGVSGQLGTELGTCSLEAAAINLHRGEVIAAVLPLIPLARGFYDRDPAIVARELLGKRLVCTSDAGLCSGRIIETEAYLAERDSACHASRGRNKKNSTMFGPPGHAYVYVIHARHCLNFVTEPDGRPSAVLVRAIEPLDGIELMQQRRGTERMLDLARGPARLCEALAIDRRQDGLDLTLGQVLWIADDPELNGAPLRIVKSPRIGVTSAHARLLRFFIAGNPYVSGRTRLASR